MSAATYNFALEQGATLLKPIIYKDSTGAVVNLTGCSARMQIRRSVSDPDVLLNMTSSNGKIQLVPLQGKITLVFSAADTALLNFSKARYDLEIVAADGSVTRLLQGEITLSKEVTRD